MRIIFHRNFKKQYRKLRHKERRRFKKRRDLFLRNPFHPLLNNHPLHGAYRGYRSMSVGGDLRIIYEEIDSRTAQFILIDTHNNLYG